ncbi:MAG: hypothetical protein ACI9OJ_003120 [Myxococcota bacterium]|jgi:hypothetical protein
MRVLVLTLFMATGLLSAAPASAQLDVRLGGFLDKVGNTPVADQAGFKSLSTDLGQILGPKMLGPAASAGGLGFDIGFDIALGRLDPDNTHWETAVGSEQNSLTALQLQVRKGLPYGFELGAVVNHLVDSELWGVGMNVKYSIIEGYRFLPDIAIRGWISTVLGSRDMSLLISGGDFTVSKEFGIAGVVSLAPYASYSLLYARATAYIVPFFVDGQPQVERWRPDPENIIVHRGALGFKLVYAHASLAFEAMISGEMQIFTTRIGADF